MPLTLNVGTSKKLGMPDFGSLGATCNLSVELSSHLIDDPDALQRQIRQAYQACSQAVADELARQQSPSNVNGNGNGNGHAAPRRSNGRRATASQARALRAIADRVQLDLGAELQRRFGTDKPEELSITEASQTIDELKSLANGNGNGHNGNGGGRS